MRVGFVAVPDRGVTTVVVTVASVARARAAFTIWAKTGYALVCVTATRICSAAVIILIARSLSTRAASSHMRGWRISSFVAGGTAAAVSVRGGVGLLAAALDELKGGKWLALNQ